MACGQSFVTPEILQRLEEARENESWMNEKLPELKKRYANRFIAIYKKKVIAAGPDFKALVETLKTENRDISAVMIEFMAGEDCYLVL
jgi:hypothetical protein